MKAAYEKKELPPDVGPAELGGTDTIFQEWCNSKSEIPQFKYWEMVLTTELKILAFILSLREGNFEAYKEAIIALLPPFFSNDNTHYSRYLTVHLFDMLVLEKKIPDVNEQFQKGNFVIHKTERIFYGIAMDQAHEQNNALIKADSGAIGLTERESALRRWMVAGSEVCRLAEQYEKFSRKRVKIHSKHHEDAPFAQKAFRKDVRNLILVLEEMGNHFLEESTTDLLTIDSKDVMYKSVLDMLYAFVPKGKNERQRQDNIFSSVE